MIDPKEIQRMRQKIDEARQIEEEILGIDEENDKADESGITPRFIADCFRLNERGDSILFAKVHRNRLVYVKKLSTWLYFAGNHWKVDEENSHINAVEEVAQYYESHAASLKDRIDELTKTDHREEAKLLSDLVNKYKARINKLRTLKGAGTCADYSHQIGKKSLRIFGEELDQKPWLLACPNAVINLATGEVVDSVPEDYLLNAVNAEWKGIDEPCPNWENFFGTIHQWDEEVMRLVHAMLGYSATGLRTEHFIGCFIGEGRNGKGTMFETLRAIFGDMGWTINPELLLEQKFNRSSAAASPDLFSLMGRRFVIASETDENARISASSVKRLTGGDTMLTRAPFEKREINFKTTHKIFIYSQYAPQGLAKDYALYKRLLFIDYPLKFIDNPKEKHERQRDPNLPAKLEAEASGILAWLVRGALIWKAEGGLHPPAKIQARIDAQRLEDDVILSFFQDSLELADSDIYVEFKSLYDKFKEHYMESTSEDTRYMPSKKKFSKWFLTHDCKPDKKGGKAIIYGVNYKPIG